jgi:hypothetical protein
MYDLRGIIIYPNAFCTFPSLPSRAPAVRWQLIAATARSKRQRRLGRRRAIREKHTVISEANGHSALFQVAKLSLVYEWIEQIYGVISY